MGLLTDGRAAFDRGAWREACARFTAADCRTPLGPEDLDHLATAAHLIGHDAESAAARARAHDGFLARGERLRAARSAFWLAFAEFDKRDRQAEAGGWLSRARRLVDESGEDCVERGFLLCASAVQHMGGGHFEVAHATFAEASAIGVAFHDRDLLALARHGEGRALVAMSRKADGLALLDEVMLDVVRGGVAPMVAGVVYCSVISACHELFDWRRAQEWTAALADWCDARPDLVPFRGACLVRRSEVMQLHGAWPAAIDEATRACARLADPPGQTDAGLAHFQLAELHRLRGDFDSADEHYRLASQAGGRLQAGPALLRLAQGRTDAACAAIRRALGETRAGRYRVPVLRAAVDIMLAAGDIAAAREAVGELAQFAAGLDAPFLDAASATAAGAVALAAGDGPTALTSLRDAAAVWQQLDAPYEIARVRMLLGALYQSMGDRDGAALEFGLAQETFERLGAVPDAARLEALASADARPAASRDGLTGREVEVLRLVATGRTNRAIAADLRISEKTVARHISNIFTKLDLSSRTAATAYAYEHKLV